MVYMHVYDLHTHVYAHGKTAMVSPRILCHLQHTLQHALQHTIQHTLQHTLQHILQHTLQHCNTHCNTRCNTLLGSATRCVTCSKTPLRHRCNQQDAPPDTKNCNTLPAATYCIKNCHIHTYFNIYIHIYIYMYIYIYIYIYKYDVHISLCTPRG